MSTDSQAKMWSAKQALVMALLCLIVGIGFGYLAHGPVKPAVQPASRMEAAQQPEAVAPPVEQQVSPEQMKQASAKASMPILERLKADPKNFELLVQAGEMYYHHKNFAEAGSYYSRALEVKDDPRVRNQFASTLFYAGDADGAISQYEKAVSTDPKNDVAMFNIGMIRLKGKNDPKGAVQQWEKLLKAFPNHPQRDQVQHMIEKVSKKSA